MIVSEFTIDWYNKGSLSGYKDILHEKTIFRIESSQMEIRTFYENDKTFYRYLLDCEPEEIYTVFESLEKTLKDFDTVISANANNNDQSYWILEINYNSGEVSRLKGQGKFPTSVFRLEQLIREIYIRHNAGCRYPLPEGPVLFG